MNNEVKLVVTADGSHTLAVPSMDEHYHSVHGALSESRHIFINAGLKYLLPSLNKIRILEIGFGTGLNALLTYIEVSKTEKHCEYISIENLPLPSEIVNKLNYPELLGFPAEKFHLLHECNWNSDISISKNFILHKIHSKLQDAVLIPDHYNLVYFDAFGPDKQPEMWTEDNLRKIFQSMKKGAVLTTYSTKGSFKRILKAHGFRIEKLPGPEGKREIMRAVKN